MHAQQPRPGTFRPCHGKSGLAGGVQTAFAGPLSWLGARTGHSPFGTTPTAGGLCRRIGVTSSPLDIGGWPTPSPRLRWCLWGDRRVLGCARLVGAFALPKPPLAHRIHNRSEASPQECERVLDFRRDLWVDLAVHDAVFLQLPQLLGEHLLGNTREGPKQLRKAPLALKELPQNQDLPSSTDDVKRPFRRALLTFPLHSHLRRPGPLPFVGDRSFAEPVSCMRLAGTTFGRGSHMVTVNLTPMAPGLWVPYSFLLVCIALRSMYFTDSTLSAIHKAICFVIPVTP
jgi:hypothetical protein